MRIGILGGSFNPIHNGHLRLALEVFERLGLARLDIVPCAIPPHKNTSALLPFALRARAVALALDIDGPGAPERGVCLNTLEQERQGPSYTVDTLQAYQQREPGCRLHFILGAGDLLELPSWKEGLSLSETTSLVVVPRQENDLDAVAAFVAAHWPEASREQTPEPEMRQAKAVWTFASGNALIYLPLPRMDISSTMVRSLWKEGRSLRGLVPGMVKGLLESQRELVAEIW